MSLVPCRNIWSWIIWAKIDHQRAADEPITSKSAALSPDKIVTVSAEGECYIAGRGDIWGHEIVVAKK